MKEVRYPNVKVKLTGEDRNALFILGRVDRAMKEAKVPYEDRQEFMREAMSGDYNKLLQTCMKWVVAT